MDRKRLARIAMTEALRVRRKCGYSPWEPVCVYDLAERVGVEVRFLDIPSMEGIYLQCSNPQIMVSSLRPPGRQAFTCAHELGHHIFNHGDQFDELIDSRSEARRSSPEEFIANCFAGILLMPKTMVNRGFSVRSLDPSTCPPEAFYIVGCWVGVGYTTIIHHLNKALRVIPDAKATELLRSRPKIIRSTILGRECPGDLIVADQYWNGRAIDTQVSDFILLPPNAIIEDECVAVVEQCNLRTLVQAKAPGIGRVFTRNPEWSAFIRTSKKNYIGRAIYRFLEEADDG